MNKLPVETIISIASYLNDQELFTASCICRKWNQVIRSTLLYKTVELDYSSKHYFDAIAFFQKYKQYAQNVRILSATSGKTIPFKEIRQWPCIFPNVIDFKLDFGSHNQQFNISFFDFMLPIEIPSSEEEDDDEKEYNQNAPIMLRQAEDNFAIWNNLEALYECNRVFLTPNILHGGKYQHLSRLTVDFEHLRVTAFPELACRLYLAPALASFSAHKAVIRTDFLEKLHDNTPLLKNLHFFSPIVLWDSSDDDITDISPALNITSVILYEVDTTHRGRNHMVRYITLKYPNVESLKMKRWEDNLGEPLLELSPNIQPEFEDAIIQLATHCTKIQYYVVDIHPFTPAILSAFDQAGTLKLKAFSSMASHISHLRSIANSKQKDYIERLDVLVPSNSEPDLLYIINKFTNLRSLVFLPSPLLGHVEDQDFPLNITLNTFLDHHQKLLNLKLSTCKLTLSDNFKAEEHKSVIESLEIVSSVIDNPSPRQPNTDLSDYLGRSCPDLKILTLSCNFKQPLIGPLDYHINFATQDLQYLCLYLKGYICICVEDLLGEVHWYSLLKRGSRFVCRREKEKPKIRRATRSKPESGVIYIKCKDAHSFSLHSGRDPNYVSFFG
ncbi:hypothetical protein BD408DRAFT_415710 [Parasitella parasitica]|nr:hypothetical protein BD408DRAFT_415710 [Parasitella parasitica]